MKMRFCLDGIGIGAPATQPLGDLSLQQLPKTKVFMNGRGREEVQKNITFYFCDPGPVISILIQIQALNSEYKDINSILLAKQRVPSSPGP